MLLGLRFRCSIRDRDSIFDFGKTWLKPDRFDEPSADCVDALDVLSLQISSHIFSVSYYEVRVLQDGGFVPHQR